MKNVTVTLLGSGYISKVHLIGYKSLSLCYPNETRRIVLKNLITRNPNGAVPQLFETAVNDVKKTDVTDIADICTPNYVHADEIKALADKGFHNIYCEKPVTGFYKSEAEMAQFAERHSIINQVALVYRFLPALIRARRLVEEGVIGNLLHFNCSLYHGSYLNPERPMSWRLKKSLSGGGALVDLGIHAIDALSYAAGNIDFAHGYTKTYIGTRPCENGTDDVDVDDFAHIEMQIGGAEGALEVSRVAAGADGSLNISLFGTKGAVHISSARPDYPDVFLVENGAWQTGTDYVFPDAEADIAALWPSEKCTLGTMQNMHMASIRCFISQISGNSFRYIHPPKFEDSARSMRLIDSIYQNGSFEASRGTK